MAKQKKKKAIKKVIKKATKKINKKTIIEPVKVVKKTVNFINSWTAGAKQADKLDIEIRISKLTIFALNIDLSKKSFSIMVLNFGLTK